MSDETTLRKQAIRKALRECSMQSVGRYVNVTPLEDLLVQVSERLDPEQCYVLGTFLCTAARVQHEAQS